MRSRHGNSRSGKLHSNEDTRRARERRSRKKHVSKMSQGAASEDQSVHTVTENSSRERRVRKRDTLRGAHSGSNRRRRYIRDEPSRGTEEAISNWVDKTTGTIGPHCDSSAAGTVDCDTIKKWVSSCCRRGLRPLLKEFGTIRKFLPKNITTDYFNKNSAKNRYTDVLCLDSTRVVLQGRTSENDYIHGNWVVLPTHRKYICTQAPLPETGEDFWHMVLKEKVPVIIMLCDLYEGAEQKCAEYYPAEVGKSVKFGEIKISNLQREKDIGTVVAFTMSVQNNEETQKVIHYKWADWPDRVAPDSAAPMLGMVQQTKAFASIGPFVVHCSAGIGRTGTYCAFEYAIDKITLGESLSAIEVIKEVRKQRLHSVQTTLQYLYLHMCILEYLVAVKIIPKDVQVRKFQREYERYLKKFNDKRADA